MGFNTQLIIHDLDDARGTMTSETSILWWNCTTPRGECTRKP
jgi:hypothetical protein